MVNLISDVMPCDMFRQAAYVNGFLWSILTRCVEDDKQPPPLWTGGQSSWLQVQRSGFVTLLYQIF
jgi:hypothetical protein